MLANPSGRLEPSRAVTSSKITASHQYLTSATYEKNNSASANMLQPSRAKLYFLYAGTSGNAGGSNPSSSSSSLLNASPAGVTTRAVTKMIRFFLMC
jgi:hypothetical protein